MLLNQLRVQEILQCETPSMPSGIVRGGDTPREESSRATKAPRLDAPDQQMMLVSQNDVQSVCQVLSLDHEDEPDPTHFEQGELDDLEDYDVGLELEENDALNLDVDEADMSDSIDRLCMPYTSHEPDVPADELANLDALADQVEISRLKGLGILLPVSSLPKGEVKRLTTRFVRTWRDKNINNERRWSRRSRYVAREFSWLSPDRQDLFSAASSNITNRLLSLHFYIERGSDGHFWLIEPMTGSYFDPAKENFIASIGPMQVMAALDIGDAFLTVDQIQPTVVSCELASGVVEEFARGKVLPGQRDGSLLWYKSLTSFFSEHLQMQPLPLYPCLLKSPDLKCLMLLHVDDILVVCSKEYLEDCLLKALRIKYKVSAEAMQFCGASVTFLKRRLLLDSFKMIIYPHPKHFTRLFELVGVKKTWKPKNVPAHSQILECFETAELSPDRASTFRSAVGILLYLSCDMVECQWTIRHLAQSMSKPTEKAWIELRHLVQYLLGCMSFGLLMHYRSSHESTDLLLKIFTDSDWASNKGTRKSVSACCIMANTCLLHSASRNQGLIALSSAEAETYAGTSGTCDGLFLARRLEFFLETSVIPKLLIDNSACRYILGRSGCGRVRHLSTRVLWVQHKVEKRELYVGPVASSENVADIGTKKLGVVTMRILVNRLGVFDSEKGELVGQTETDEKHSKQAIRLLAKKQGVNSIKMIQLILASSLVPATSNALSCDCMDIWLRVMMLAWLPFPGPFSMDPMVMVMAI